MLLFIAHFFTTRNDFAYRAGVPIALSAPDDPALITVHEAQTVLMNLLLNILPT
jgi:hypothetical protein